MSDPRNTGAAPGRAAPAPAPAAYDQILAIWQALRANPDLDARCAMQAIDRLLDQRADLAADPARAVSPGPEAAAPRTLEPGSPAQLAVLASALRALFTGDAG